jgi:hypothetical protein
MPAIATELEDSVPSRSRSRLIIVWYGARVFANGVCLFY